MAFRKQKWEWKNWRGVLQEVIYEADTPSGKAFDIGLIIAIFASVIIVLLDSVDWINAEYGSYFYALEWGFTILFSIEYVLRIISIARPMSYCLSFFGMVDLLAILPTYLSLFLAGAQSLLVIRVLRLLRIFRVLKLAHFLGDERFLMRALYESRRKIIIFLFTVLNIVLIAGALFYVLENDQPGFRNIPESIYWAIVTVTTVGYGDTVPHTLLGRFVASILMIVGYAIIAVPTGILTNEFYNQKHSNRKTPINTQCCPSCALEGHSSDAIYCKRCGVAL